VEATEWLTLNAMSDKSAASAPPKSDTSTKSVVVDCGAGGGNGGGDGGVFAGGGGDGDSFVASIKDAVCTHFEPNPVANEPS
jgi:hypothetical protein